MKLGLFGGSFDPPHLGHVKLVTAAAARCGLDRAVIIPAACSPFKTNTRCGDADRMEMCRLSFPPMCEISDYEIARGGVSYTIETVLHFRARNPGAELFLIVGEDQLLLFPKWYRWKEILHNAGLIAAVRSSSENRALLERFADQNLRAWGSVTVLAFEPIPISSTALRRALDENGSIEGMLSPETAEYIKEKGLYRDL